MEKKKSKQKVEELVQGFSKVCDGKATVYECLLAAYGFIATLYIDSSLTMEEIRENASEWFGKINRAVAATRERMKNLEK